MQSQGLSPRVRGNLGSECLQAVFTGSIPACAGNPWRMGRKEAWMRSIPACAGNPSRCFALTLLKRSIPACAGERSFSTFKAMALRSIPACAGEPWQSRTTQISVKVYPRVCGGTFWTSIGNYSRKGLSPRVRGNLTRFLLEPFLVRSIPACAGEPATKAVAALRNEVYPRVCGGTGLGKLVPLLLGGLSPRVRGNP